MREKLKLLYEDVLLTLDFKKLPLPYTIGFFSFFLNLYFSMNLFQLEITSFLTNSKKRGGSEFIGIFSFFLCIFTANSLPDLPISMLFFIEKKCIFGVTPYAYGKVMTVSVYSIFQLPPFNFYRNCTICHLLSIIVCQFINDGDMVITFRIVPLCEW